MNLKEFAGLFGSRSTDTIAELQTELEGQLSALHNAALVSETDVKGNITFVNDRFVEVSGYSREELMGQNHRILKSGHQPDDIFVDLWQQISSGNYWQGEVCNKAKDGSFYWVIATITPVMNPKTGKPQKYISVRFEISQHKEMEQELHQTLEEVRAHEEELRQTMEEVDATNEQLTDTQRELKSQIEALNNAAIVSETDVKGNITYVNDKFCEISQYTRDELIGQNHRMLKSGHQPDSIFEDLWKTISSGKVWRGIIKNKKKDGGFYWVHTTVTPVLGTTTGKPERYIAVRVDITSEMEKEERLESTSETVEELNQSLALAKEALEKQLDAKQNELQESVTYAQRMMRAIIPKPEKLTEQVPEPFSAEVFFQPRDAVGGDFYWQGQSKNKTVLALGDGTGHGVPGAFLSLLGNCLMTNIVEDRGITEPTNVLEQMDHEVKRQLHQEDTSQDFVNEDSIEMGIATFTEGNPRLQVGLANRPMVIVRSGELEEVAPSKKIIGGTQFMGDEFFEMHQVDLNAGDMLFLFSDGYKDQFGGPGGANKKFGKRGFYDLLTEVAQLERASDRQKALHKTLQDWKGFFRDQTDDICILMIRREQ